MLCDIPTLGVSKKLLYCRGLTEEIVKQTLEQSKLKGVDPILTDQKSGKEIACVLSRGNNQQLFISPGHRIDLPTSVTLVKNMMLGENLPRPIFYADSYSRQFLVDNYESTFN